jgi:hypothetical protein
MTVKKRKDSANKVGRVPPFINRVGSAPPGSVKRKNGSDARLARIRKTLEA